ncbi:hypothetical protein QFZ43_006287 [Streptomyces afghaniensis]|nr:hypothetical protein [Streptomyces afghaniensis]
MPIQRSDVRYTAVATAEGDRKATRGNITVTLV